MARRSVTVELGEVEHTIYELPQAKNVAWRAALEEEFAPYMDLVDADMSPGMVRSLVTLIMQTPGRATGLLLAYAQDLTEDELAEAYESEIFDAFVAVLTQLAFPFGSMVTAARTLSQIGDQSREAGTNGSSSSASTAASRKRSTAGRG